MTNVTMTHDYDAPAQAVWCLCTDFNALQHVCAPLLAFEGLPEGRIREGQSLQVDVRLFGYLPPIPYRMYLEHCDESAMSFQSRETGGGVEQWDHALRVVPKGEDRCQIVETLVIDAGWKTPAYTSWARFLYGHRHKRRLQMLSEGGVPKLCKQ